MLVRSLALACATLAMATAATADPVADFYRGKSIRLALPNSPGGSTTLYGLTVSEFWQRHIPGNPTIVIEYRTGAGGITASNHMYSVAPKDGIALLMLVAGQISQDIEPESARFDAAKFAYIGRAADLPRAIVAWHASGLKSVEGAREKVYTIGAANRGSVTYLQPAAMNIIAGTKLKIVTGYSGAGPMYLALERGEVDLASVGFEGLTSVRAAWMRDKQVNMIVTIGSRPFPGHESVPNIVDLGRTPEDKEMLSYMSHQSDMGQVFVGPPGMPADRLEALRRAFDATMRDPEFLANAAKKQMEVIPRTGEQMQAFAEQVARRSPEVVARLKKVAME